MSPAAEKSATHPVSKRPLANLLSALRTLRELDPQAWWCYLRLRVSGPPRLSREFLAASLSSGSTIMFVCFGNIIRSAMAEALLRRELEQRQIPLRAASCGTNAREGRVADARAMHVSAEIGLSLELHHASPAAATTLESSALIFAMDFATQARLLSQFPPVRRKCFLLPTTPSACSPEVPDPYMGSEADVRACRDELAGRIHHLVEAIASGRAGAADVNQSLSSRASAADNQ